MADPFIGEIRAVCFNFAPMDWAYCNGQTVNIQQFQALYSLLRTKFGGDGKNTFGLPNLQGKCVIGQGQGLGLSSRTLGEFGGDLNVQLHGANMPAHNHTASIGGTGVVNFKMSGDQGDIDDPTGAMFAKIKTGTTFQKSYDVTSSTVITMSPNSVTVDTSKLTVSISPTGIGASFSIMQPFLVLNYIIALNGDYPVRPQ